MYARSALFCARSAARLSSSKMPAARRCAARSPASASACRRAAWVCSIIPGAVCASTVDADTASEASVRREAIGVEDIIDEMSKPRPDRMNVLVLDTCRDAPYGDRREGSAPDDGRRRRVPPDLLVAQATEPGSIALDTGSGHGLYTEELLDAIAATGDPRSTETFDRIAAAVSARTRKTQVPQTMASLAAGFELAAYADQPGSPGVSLDGHGDVRLTTHRGIRSSGQNPDV